MGHASPTISLLCCLMKNILSLLSIVHFDESRCPLLGPIEASLDEVFGKTITGK